MADPSLYSHSSQTLLHSILFVFSLVFLPRSSYPYSTGSSGAPLQTKSADKPQTPWLNPLTYHPPATLLWWILGSIIICVFRAGWIRNNSHGSTTQQSREKRGQALFIRLVQALAATVMLTPLMTIFLALLGAPLTSDPFKPNLNFSSSTPLLALLLNVLVFFTPCYVLGVPLLSIGELIDSIHWLSALGISSKMFTDNEQSTGKDALRERIRLSILFSSVFTFHLTSY